MEMKKVLFVIILLSSFIIFSGFTFNIGDTVDRSMPIKYPNIPRNADTVYVFMEKGYAYHNSRNCNTESELLGLNKKEYLEILEYEARLRGFFECPDCTDRAERLDVYYIDDIYEKIDDIYDALFSY